MPAPASETQWYLARDGQQFGPISDAELAKFIELGYLQPTDLLWREGFPDWRPALVVFPPRSPARPSAARILDKLQAPPTAGPPSSSKEAPPPPNAGWSTAVTGPQLAAELVGHALAGTAKGAAYSLGVFAVFLSVVLLVWLGCSFSVWLFALDGNDTWLIVNKYLWQVALVILAAYSFSQSKSFDVTARLRQLLRQERDLSLAQAELSILDRVQASYASTIAQLFAGVLIFLSASLAWNAANGDVFISGRISDDLVVSFTIDLVARGLLFDIVEHFDLSFTRARMNYSNWSYVIFAFVFRLYVSLLILKTIVDNFSVYLNLRRGRLEFERAYKEARSELIPSGLAS
jgi:hypothetical protein